VTQGKGLRVLPLAFSIVCLIGGCSSEHKAGPELVRPVKTMVIAGYKPTVRSFPGKVEASKKVDLAFQIPGLLVKEPGKAGEKVPKGGIIAQLRQDEFQARVKSAQGQLDQALATLKALQSGERSEEQLRRESQLRAAEAKLENTRTEFDRYARLLDSSAVSRSDYELAKTAYHVAQEEQQAAQQIVEKGASARKEDIEAQEAVVRGLEGRLAEANLQLRDTTLRAPYDGIIAQRLADEGQNVAVSTPVIKFQDVSEIDIVVDVPEAFMATEIRSAAIQSMLAEFSMAPGRQFPVDVKEATQVGDPKTQTFQIRVAMKPPSGFTVLPGMTATVTVVYQPTGNKGNRILVPVSAVTMLETGKQVAWVIGPDQVVSARPVKVGSATGGEIEVVQGLQQGDRIVVAGVTYLRDGMKVRDLGDALGAPRV
jgi:multidrug efflux system membrane fusion protein